MFMGCDISQDDFTFCLRNQAGIISQGKVVNSATAISKWLDQLKKVEKYDLEKIVFCMEHTGIYGYFLMRILHKRSLMICVESAMHIKSSLGMQRGKNDKVDAQRIAEYAMRFTDRLKCWQPKRDVLEKLQLLNGARSRMVKVRTILSRHTVDVNHYMGDAFGETLELCQESTIKAIKRDIEGIDKQIELLIKSDENLERLSRYITSVKGIGIVTCAALLVRTNEFKDYTDHKKFACSVGIVPFEHTSGKSVKGKSRVSPKAHKDTKTLLHMCAVSCISRPGELKDYYDRKVSEGKNKMAVLNAIRNKLVSRVFAVVKNQVMYQENYQYHLQES